MIYNRTNVIINVPAMYSASGNVTKAHGGALMQNIISGIYAIVNKRNGKRYIGSSVNIHRRWIEHRSSLNCSKHVNRILQFAWSKYGEGAFDFVVLEHCDRSKLIQREQFYMNSLRPFYNVSQTASFPPALRIPKTCNQCGNGYIAKRTDQKFCSNACKSKWRRDNNLDSVSKSCVICGNEFMTNKYKGTKVCSNICAGKLLWKNISEASRTLHRKKLGNARKLRHKSNLAA